ncbi:hypothetical protein [Flavobacterium sp. HTF]|uniref:hypothetical protein n=1 Tax=Flavobacterium sp. HTF TaxID=2170732 RepID=UPI000D5CD29B|nr:hypothetical protein [Flavobacterium sp. HTF]PWB26395.1 hypothetical protein DCO46_06210 [Flavobacterium sp. HTF]
MKTFFITALLVIAFFFVVRQFIYKPYAWKKAINSKEHQLQVGSFIFSSERGSNGSQSFTTHYFVFKVIEINGDFVRFSVIRKLSEKYKLVQGDFSTTSSDYKKLKKTVKEKLITPILRDDLYKGEGPSYMLNDYLVGKYPDLNTSRYYYEDIPAEEKNKALPTDPLDLTLYFSLVYSKKEIIEHGKLTPWIMNNSLKNAPELADRLSKKIDLILN